MKEMKDYKILILLYVIGLLFLAACQNENSTDTTIKVIVANPIIMTHNITDADMDIEVKGTLLYEEDNQCIFIEQANKQGKIVPIWPKGSTPTMEGNQYGVDARDIGVLLEGEEVELNGGSIEIDEVTEMDQYPEACLTDVDQIVQIMP